jgi:hypothetical protein
MPLLVYVFNCVNKVLVKETACNDLYGLSYVKIIRKKG